MTIHPVLLAAAVAVFVAVHTASWAALTRRERDMEDRERVLTNLYRRDHR